ncbi:MAG: PilZ domain-containing protein [Planctomycetota bacterium]|nr:PilZ domain-containing protein [Planctomycetota bacterium]
MSFIRNVNAVLDAAAHALGRDRRQAGRMYVLGIRCDRGRVLDLSAGGARILTRAPSRVGDSRHIAFSSASGSVRVKFRCAWRERTGVMSWIVGYEFQDVDDDARRILTQIAMAHKLSPELRAAA